MAGESKIRLDKTLIRVVSARIDSRKTKFSIPQMNHEIFHIQLQMSRGKFEEMNDEIEYFFNLLSVYLIFVVCISKSMILYSFS